MLFRMHLIAILALSNLLDPSFDAMGGRAKLEALTSLEYVAIGERDMVEQSERPTGPYFFDHFRVHEIRDLTKQRVRIEQTDEGYAADKWWTDQPPQQPQVMIIDDDVAERVTAQGPQYGGGYLIETNEEQFAFAPERLLLTAAEASDLREEPDVTLHGVRHRVYAFTWHGAPCTLYVNAVTGLPWQLAYVRPFLYQTFLSAWGDVTTRITYNGWALEGNGIVYPREWSFERVGLPDTRLSIVSLHFNRPVDQQTISVTPEIYDAHHGKLRKIEDIPLGYAGDGKPLQIAPGILRIPGGWNVEFIEQADGIVALEAPWSPAYTQRAFDAAIAAFHKPIKAVVTTSDSWPHLAGVRQAVADGIPVYALDLNEPILRRLLAAPHDAHPDDLARHPRDAVFHFVTNRTTVGSGTNRIEIIPYRTATGERQMMVYIPQRRLLYTSDLFAPDGSGGWFTPEYVHEALGAISREHIEADTIFGMHYGPTPIGELGKRTNG